MTKTVYIVFSEYGKYVEEVFSTKEKAEDFIKNNKKAECERKSYNDTWETYLSCDPCDVYLSMAKFYVK